MNYDSFIKTITSVSNINSSFEEKTDILNKKINSITIYEITSILKEIGTIPENIEHDSSEEKLYSKATDIILSLCFEFIGLKSNVIATRANSADVIA